ncbi:hypothetical protein GN244_ATG09932 [Phytophthora infestans]|uniref:Uncharacterized protein n=1 Tax=Phytophthora infestans TaxID=4787 RepID=A0A833SS79_PHYIN|nr:hypothetical protein GN244_ATG09932 [Phytophthora infestans]
MKNMQSVKCLGAAVMSILLLQATVDADEYGVDAFYEDATCTTTLIANVNPNECKNFVCKDGNSNFCVADTATYLKTAFGVSPYVVTEEFRGGNCNKLIGISAFVADGHGHVGHKDDGSKWAMATTVSGDGDENGRVQWIGSRLLSAQDYYLGPVSKEYINSNACAPIDEPPYFAKFYYVDPPSSSSPDSKSGSSDSGSSTDSAKANTTTTGGASTFESATSSVLVCALLVVLGTLIQ